MHHQFLEFFKNRIFLHSNDVFPILLYGQTAPGALHCKHYRAQWTRGNDVSSESRVRRKKITDSLLYMYYYY